MSTPLQPTRIRRALAALATAVAGLLLLAAPAGAHGGPGRLELVSATRSGTAVDLEVRLTYVEDGHGVPDATVTAVVDGATPTTLVPGAEDGLYAGTVEAPEGSVIRITSVEPAVTLEVDAPPAEEAPTTEAPTTTEATTTTEASTTTAADDDGDDADGAATTVEDEDDDDSSLLPIVAGVAAVAVIGAVVAVLLLRKPSSGDDGGAGTDRSGPVDGA